MAKLELKIKAQELRKRGRSIKQIASELYAPVSTISMWCRDIKLTPKQINKLTQRQKRGTYRGILRAAEKKREERKRKIIRLNEQGMEEVGKLSEREFFLTGIALYWGEGFKTEDGSVGVSLGDPVMVRFFISWAKKYLAGSKERLQLRLTLNEQYKDREQTIKNFWIKELNLHHGQFQKTMLITSAKPKRYYSNKTYRGTLRIVLSKSTDDLRLVRGWIKGLHNNTSG